MVDALETASAWGIDLHPKGPNEPKLEAFKHSKQRSFDDMVRKRVPLTFVLNDLNRGLGLADGYLCLGFWSDTLGDASRSP